MKGLLSKHTNPAYNLATEEYLLRHTQEDVFFLYTNEPSIIVGKHQNTLGEINYDFIQRKNLPVYRRLSGGGTVYHDPYNLNFCFIKTGEKGQLVNFARYSEPILMALRELGIEATFGKRHDIQIDGKKISGNASHVYKNRVMHHGTLLFKADLNTLNEALKTNPLSIKDKAVKSVRSEVTNIYDHLQSKIDYPSFTQYIFNYLLAYYKTSSKLELNKDAEAQIKAYTETKYTTWEWNYGYSPNFSLNRTYRLTNNARIKAFLQVEKGRITDCNLLSSDKNLNFLLENISHKMLGIQHSSYLIKDIISQIQYSQLSQEDLQRIERGFFS
ncbi:MULTISPECIES: lipoate--protein ligase [unclassified Carboxylicivirga]|uniref:lipoate--protein ligase n=1 Tax=Carboxylicivirga TaxID=1628153 RepID=UPI003D347E32